MDMREPHRLSFFVKKDKISQHSGIFYCCLTFLYLVYNVYHVKHVRQSHVLSADDK